MLQQEATIPSKSSCDWAAIKARRSPRRGRSHSASSASLATLSSALPALVNAGHGLATIGFCLGLNVEWILEQVALLGLPTPSARPMRRPSGKSHWTTEQIQKLILLWPTNLYATCIGEKTGRNPASVRYKAKWLGLAVRDRSKLVRTAPDVPTVSVLDPSSNGWTVDLGFKVGCRYIRGQHSAGIARDFGRSFNSINSRTCHIGLPGRHEFGSQLKMDHHAADPVLKKFAVESWVYRQCNFNPAHWFWAPRMGDRTSPASKNSRAYKDRIASSHGDHSDVDIGDD